MDHWSFSQPNHAGAVTTDESSGPLGPIQAVACVVL